MRAQPVQLARADQPVGKRGHVEFVVEHDEAGRRLVLARQPGRDLAPRSRASMFGVTSTISAAQPAAAKSACNAAKGTVSRQLELTTTTAAVARTIALSTATLAGSRKSSNPRGSCGRVETLFITPSMSRKMTLRATPGAYARSPRRTNRACHSIASATGAALASHTPARSPRGIE